MVGRRRQERGVRARHTDGSGDIRIRIKGRRAFVAMWWEGVYGCGLWRLDVTHVVLEVHKLRVVGVVGEVGGLRRTGGGW